MSTILLLQDADADRLRRAWWINLVSSAGAVAGRFVIGLLLARMLAPAALGLFATALAIVGVAQLLRDLGVSSYLQREPVLDPERFGACVGVQLAASTTLALALLLSANALAALFQQPALAAPVRVLTLELLIVPFASLMAALQLRTLDAARIALISRLGTISWGLAATGAAWLGTGALGLAWAKELQVLICTLAYWPMRPRGLSWRPRWSNWRPILRFGAGALGSNLLNGLNGLLPDLLLGRLGGVAQVALLGRANAVVGALQGMAGGAIGFGTLPQVARRHAQGLSPAEGIARASMLLSGVAWPLLALVVLQREALVRLLFGPAWSDSAAAIPPLALAAAIGLALHHAGLALTAIGRPHLAAALGAAQLLARLGLGVLLYDGSTASFAWALAVAALLMLPLQHQLFAANLQLGLGRLMRASGRSLAVAAACAAAAAPWHQLGPAVAAALLAWPLALRLTRHPLWAELSQLARLRSTTRK